MKIFKQLRYYLFWIIICLLGGLAHMRIVLGPPPKPSKGIMKMFDWIYGVSLVHVGLVVGGIIALLFIVLDIYYLKKKLKDNPKKMGIRFLVVLALTAVVGITHYILEKVVDVI